uniref:IFT140 first beta-propeller domain-containing protein n=1 Tax=Romanomermis culicivorax TaxID=13658 RepID=A0A915J5K8_ROMCU
MSAYFAYQVQLADAPSVRHKVIKWHPKFKDIFAVGSCDERGDGGEINLFDDEGQKVKGSNNSLKKPTAKPLQLAWHPTKKILAVAWSTGLINVWNCAKNKAHNVGRRNDNQKSWFNLGHEVYVISGAVDLEINNVQWSSEGSKLLVTDRAGDVFLHKIDLKGRPVDNGTTKTKLKEPISCVLLKPPFDVHKDSGNAAPPEDALNEFRTKRAVIAPAESSTFFLGGETGGIYFVKENGQVNEMFTLNKCVMFLTFSAKNNILICISNDLMLSRHQISASSSSDATEMSKVKINAKLEKLNILPIRDNVLAISCGELSVR